MSRDVSFFSFPPSQRSIVKAYAECAEMLLLRTTRFPLPNETPTTAYGILEEYKGLAETYETLEDGYPKKRFATGTSLILQWKMREIDAMPADKQRLYKTEPKEAFRRNMVWDGLEFYGVGFEKTIHARPEKFYRDLCKYSQEMLQAIAIYGEAECGKEKQRILYADQYALNGRLKQRLQAYDFLK